jgi:uncharacterized protein (TIGR03435 family)
VTIRNTAAVLALAWTVAAQRPPANQSAGPAFEVGSIRPTQTRDGGVTGGCRGVDSRLAADDPRMRVPLGRCLITAGRLSHMMAMAFEMPLQRISGFPEWDGPNRFDLQAKAEDSATATERQLLAMLRQFLTEQFRLAVHREMKDGPTLSLVVAKNGPKNLHPSKDEGERMMPGGTRLAFTGYSMPRLSEFLSGLTAVQRPVKDMTALEGRFDFTIEMLESPVSSIADTKRAIGSWETVFSDVQEQLGLRLEPSRGPVETLVVDHAELPRAQ